VRVPCAPTGMTSYQAELGDGEEGAVADTDIAEELAANQRQISIAEFFEKNKQMLGFDSDAKALVTAVKEAVDNALDATEEAGIQPKIYVRIEEAGDYYRLVVEDNGPGITKEEIPKVFGKLLYGSRFGTRAQSRGQQGIGISAAVMYAQLTSGKPAKITSRTQGSDTAKYFELTIDTETNEPEIGVEREQSPAESDLTPTHGTRIELEMEANMRARSRLHDYVAHTAVVNPHARIELVEPDGEFTYDWATDALPDDTEEIQPHPHGVELGTLIKMLEATDCRTVRSFLQTEFTRVGAGTADSILDGFRDRHFGREMPWSPPDADRLASAVRDAVANKASDAVEDFVTCLVDGEAGDADDVDGLAERDAVTHHELLAAVDAAAEWVQTEHDTTFGETVRENVVTAVWSVITGDGTDEEDGADDAPDGKQRRFGDLHAIVDDVTTAQKDEDTVSGLAERLAGRIADDEDRRDRMTRDRLREHVERAADLTVEYDDATVGETARENITEAVWERMRTVPDDVPRVRDVDRDAASELLAAMRAADVISPPTDCLSPIGDDLVEEGLRKEFDADFYAAATRDADVHGGDPFVVEAGIAYGGDIDEEGAAEVMRFANRVPLVYQRGACATTDVVKRINWRNYGLDQPGGSGIPNGPAVLLVHVASTNVPFTSESKDAIANLPAIEDEIELALREAARELKSHLDRQRSLQKRREKQNVLATILPEMAEKLADVTGREPLNIDDSLARIMNNVLVERRVDGDAVELLVENNAGTNADPELTEMVSVEPTNVSDGASVVEMDGEWFLKWSPTVPSGEEATLTYELEDTEGATFDLSVEGIESEKLTTDA